MDNKPVKKKTRLSTSTTQSAKEESGFIFIDDAYTGRVISNTVGTLHMFMRPEEDLERGTQFACERENQR
jgi:pyrimidine operon attenuation protein/uracil phosphoribosyltransferase